MSEKGQRFGHKAWRHKKLLAVTPSAAGRTTNMARHGYKREWTLVARIELVALTCGFFMTLASGQSAGPQVVTQYGRILGIYADQAAIFYGVPYAADPVGNLR